MKNKYQLRKFKGERANEKKKELEEMRVSTQCFCFGSDAHLYTSTHKTIFPELMSFFHSHPFCFVGMNAYEQRSAFVCLVGDEPFCICCALFSRFCFCFPGTIKRHNRRGYFLAQREQKWETNCECNCKKSRPKHNVIFFSFWSIHVFQPTDN